MKKQLFLIALVLSPIGVGYSVLITHRIYKQQAAMRGWDDVRLDQFAWRGQCLITTHTPAFLSVMKAYGLKEGDPPSKFIAVFGQPDRVFPKPNLGLETKGYRWKWDTYYWPAPKMKPGFPIYPSTQVVNR